MEEIKKTNIQVIKSSVVLNLVFTVFVLVIAPPESRVGYIYGSWFGLAVAILNFALLSLSVFQTSTMTPDQAKKHAFSRYIMRYAIVGLSVYVAVVYLTNYVNILGLLFGLSATSLAIYGQNFYEASKQTTPPKPHVRDKKVSKAYDKVLKNKQEKEAEVKKVS